jgi:uncharacterized protein
MTSALWNLVFMGNVEDARKMLEGGADVEATGGLDSDPTEEKSGPFLTSPLHIAVQRTMFVKLEGQPSREDASAMVELLLDYGADVTVMDSTGNTVLNASASHGPAGIGLPFIVTMLLQKGALVDQPDDRGWTPLHNAALYNYGPVVKILLENGANVLAENSGQMTAEACALATESHETLAIIRAEMLSRAKCLAFAMGLQERLGAVSIVNKIEPSLLKIILDIV